MYINPEPREVYVECNILFGLVGGQGAGWGKYQSHLLTSKPGSKRVFVISITLNNQNFSRFLCILAYYSNTDGINGKRIPIL